MTVIIRFTTWWTFWQKMIRIVKLENNIHWPTWVDSLVDMNEVISFLGKKGLLLTQKFSGEKRIVVDSDILNCCVSSVLNNSCISLYFLSVILISFWIKKTLITNFFCSHPSDCFLSIFILSSLRWLSSYYLEPDFSFFLWLILLPLNNS